jgi:YVTN family beta-propeller protein
MKWTYPFVLGLLVLSASCSNTSSSYYYTANEGGSISKINAVKNSVVDTIKIDGSVHNVQVSPDGKIIGATVVPQMGSHFEGGHDMRMNGTAVFYDSKTNKFIKKVEVGSHPAHIVFTEDGKYAVITNNGDNNVSVIDTESYEVVKTIPTGKAPHGFRISKDSKYAYIANMGEDTVSVLDLTGFTELKKIKVGKTPVTTGITSDNKTLLVTLNAENAVAIVDLVTGRVEKVPVGTGPAQVFISPNDRFAYIANQGTEEHPSHSITKIDIEAKKVMATIETGLGTHGVVTSSDGKFLYATNMYENTVSVIDAEQNKVTSTVKVGQTPNGISFQKP